ncbi:MAG: precorrin-3B synthase [Pseudonocardiales bacterium]|nr:precorrin-3B synthase [Pseudonocardiales bacterium]
MAPSPRRPGVYDRLVALSLVTTRTDRNDASSGHSRESRGGVDRCPGSVEVHRAEDGGLARIRVPGGVLTRDSLVALTGLAAELGNGRIELTARGNLQLRGLAPGAEVELSARLAAHGLLPSVPHDRARNVLASPLSGRDGVGVLDVRPLVAELDRRLCADPELAALPGRFLFALDDGRGDVAGQRADVAVLALPDQRVALLLGGRDSGLRLPVRAAVTGLLASATAFLRRRADERVWRVAELPDGPLELVPDVRAALVAGLGGDAAGTLGGDPASWLGGGPAVSVPDRDPRGPVGRIEQTDGRVALAASVPLGELTQSRCQVLAAVAEREVLLTPWRGVVLPDVAPPATELAARRLTGAGLLLDPASPSLGVSACTGRPGCAKALADVRADASGAAGRAAGTAVPPAEDVDGVRLPVHWSGCARRCGRPAGPAVDVVAEVGGYQVLRDGEAVYAGADLGAVRAAAAQARNSR